MIKITGLGDIYDNSTLIGTVDTLVFTDKGQEFTLSPLVPNGTKNLHAVNKSQLDSKQDTLVSGTNIKTLNGTSLLGSGNITISTPDATETVKGLVELATSAEVQTGTDTTRAVTPAGLKAGVPELIADFTLGAIGTYAYLGLATAGAGITAGTVYAGSSLRYAGTSEVTSAGASANTWVTWGSAPAGNWMAVGHVGAYVSYYPQTLFLRVS